MTNSLLPTINLFMGLNLMKDDTTIPKFNEWRYHYSQIWWITIPLFPNLMNYDTTIPKFPTDPKIIEKVTPAYLDTPLSRHFSHVPCYVEDYDQFEWTTNLWVSISLNP